MRRVQETLDFEADDPLLVHERTRRVLQSLAFAIRSSVHSMSGYSPAELVFCRGMIVHCKAMVDWNVVMARCRSDQVRDNDRENKARITHEYRVEDSVMVVTRTNERKGKTEGYQHKGPFKVVKVNSNGTVVIKLNNYHEPINIRRIKPYVSVGIEKG